MKRQGSTIMELLIGCVLLSAATVTTSMFHTRTTTIARSLKVSALARDALLNAREVVATWTVAEVTQERVASLTIRDELKDLLPEATWIARIDNVEEPVLGLRIFLDLRWVDGGQTRSASGITFWLADVDSHQATAE